MFSRASVVAILLLCSLVPLVAGFIARREPCPPFECAAVSCMRPDCESPYTLVNGGYCGCCTICILEVDAGGSCDQDILTQSRVCKTGLICDPETSTCSTA